MNDNESIVDLRIRLLESKIYEYNINIDKLCEGVCTGVYLKALMSGKRYADKIYIDALMQRADIPTERYESIVSRQEYNIIQKMDEIIDAIDKGNKEIVCCKLSEYETLIENKNKLYIQLKNLMEGIWYYVDDESEKAILVLYNAMHITRPSYLEAKSLIKSMCTYVELAIHIMMLAVKAKCKEDLCNKSELINEIKLWNEHYNSSTNKDKCGMLCNWAVYICRIAEKNEMYDVIEDISGKSLKLLKNTSCTWTCREQLRNWSKYTANSSRDTAVKMLEHIEKVYNKYDVCSESISWAVPYATREIYAIDDVIRIRRKSMNLSQEQLATGICSGKTISNIEQGKFNPKPREKKKILEILGIKYSEYGVIDSEDLEIHKEMLEWDEALNAHDYESCKEKYQKYWGMLKKTKVNKQYLEFRRIANEIVRRAVNDDSTVADYINALELTCKSWKTNKEWIYSSTEINILYNMGDLFFQRAVNDKNALNMADYICDTIVSFYKQQELGCRHFMSGLSLIETIFGSWYGSLGYIDKAMIMSESNIRNELLYGGSKLVALRIYDVGWNMEEKFKNKTEESIRCMQQAYALAFLVNKPFVGAIEEEVTL